MDYVRRDATDTNTRGHTHIQTQKYTNTRIDVYTRTDTTHRHTDTQTDAALTMMNVLQPTTEDVLSASHDFDWKPPHHVVSRGSCRCSVYLVIGRVCVMYTVPDASIA